MVKCRLRNGAIVPLAEVLIVTESLESLLNDLLASDNLGFSRKFPFNVLNNIIKFDQYNITNDQVKAMLIKHGLLNSQGLMPLDTRDILESGFEWECEHPGFYTPHIEILGDADCIQPKL